MVRTHGIGRLTEEPEVRYTQDGKISVASFTLATDRYTTSGNKTDFIRHVAFGKNAEFAERYLHKGTKIFIEGHLQTGSYDKDGVKHYTTDIAVDSFEFCEKKGEDDHKAREQAEMMDVIQEELPFK